ncbi:hypothetical protein HYPDE_30653 [Hyphomicrobium denitrificans 1NES1]|uniref:Uncharacterized protein n=1 Tax=Hyphomicrobium denitrificans 1NES1 TaxID=670307 RepID=N0BCF6_9HYPH|nr:hypothetical protein HYPDE_30653 [Hyphomicrobium denitrificans 1NES1]
MIDLSWNQAALPGFMTSNDGWRSGCGGPVKSKVPKFKHASPNSIAPSKSSVALQCAEAATSTGI